MAPGCYSPSSAKESSSSHAKSVVSNEPTTNESGLDRAMNEPEDVYSLLKTSSASSSSSTTSSDRIISKETAESTINLEKSMALECYAGEINLDQIPLPSTPPPQHSMLLLHGVDDEEEHEEEEEDEEDEEESTDESEDEESEEEEEEEEESDDDEEEEEEKKKEGKDHLLKVTSPRLKSVGRSANLIFDTVDTFEILEQTIIKQKRLAKLKNTDLRRKVLLKRTFDRVLEIMDAENGFNDNDDLDLLPSTTTTTVAATTQSNKSIDETEKSLNVVLLEQQQPMDLLELELHPDPSSPMDDSDDEEESDEDTAKRNDEISSTSSTTTTTTNSSTTLVKLVDIPTSPSEVNLESSTALVPRQVKRRSSASDDEEDEDENEDEDDRTDQSTLEETCFYEYSMNHLLNDQQLNYRRSKLDRHERRPGKTSDELNLYCSSVDLQVVDEQANSLSLQRRSNHPRKKLRAA